MAPSGNVLYYAFTNGTVVALSVGTFPTDAPTSVPTATPNVAPTSVPLATSAPSLSVRTTAAPSLRGSQSDSSNGTAGSENDATQPETSDSALNLPIVLGAAAGGLVLLVALALLCVY